MLRWLYSLDDRDLYMVLNGREVGKNKHLFISHWFKDGRPRDDFGKDMFNRNLFHNVKIQGKKKYMFSLDMDRIFKDV